MYASASTPSSSFNTTSQCRSRITWSIVSVPVLSVHSTSIAPRFWMALIRLTMTFLRAIASAPLDRHTVTIIGSISGVSPTATARAKKNASCQLCLVRPLITNTSGTMTSMNRSMSHVKREMPLSKAVCGRCSVSDSAMPPRYVSRPVATTRASAEPLSTLVPRKAMSVSSIGDRPGGPRSVSNFSIGSDSPVSEPWITNRSLAETTRTSAGIMSPAASLTTSPGTSCETGVSWSWPSRRTVAVTEIIALSLVAALSAFASWISFRPTPIAIMSDITLPARTSPVAKEIVASTASSSTSGFMTACHTNSAMLLRASPATTLGPCSTSRVAASSAVRPVGRLPSRWCTISGASAADSTTSGATRTAGCSERIAAKRCFGSMIEGASLIIRMGKLGTATPR